MSANSKIEWTDDTWNPVTGCTEVSPGCDHCYAKTFAERWRGTPGHHFEQGFDVVLRPERLEQPIKWKRPRRIFVNSMSDLFHDAVSDDYIASVFAVMAIAGQHTFQVLTKRHGRMRSLLLSQDFRTMVHRAMRRFEGPVNHLDDVDPADGGTCGNCARGVGHGSFNWPLPNVWLGVSVENQQWADIRIPALLDTPAAVRFLSMEPLLGPTKIAPWIHTWQCHADFSHGVPGDCTCDLSNRRLIDWVIVGGESGPGARPMHPAWVRALRDQCTTAGVAFHFKQWGAWATHAHRSDAWWERPPGAWVSQVDGRVVTEQEALEDGGAFVGVWRVGKTAAGRELDRRTWDEFPGEEQS